MNCQVYVLRVDEEGNQYNGYITGLVENLYDELKIDRTWMDEIAITDELSIISNKESAVMGLPLNRAVYDAFGNLVTVVGGNVFIQKCCSGIPVDISLDDIEVLEDRLRAIITISHGFVFTKPGDELPEWRVIG